MGKVNYRFVVERKRRIVAREIYLSTCILVDHKMSKTMRLSWSKNRRRYEFALRMKIMTFDTICVFLLLRLLIFRYSSSSRENSSHIRLMPMIRIGLKRQLTRSYKSRFLVIPCNVKSRVDRWPEISAVCRIEEKTKLVKYTIERRLSRQMTINSAGERISCVRWND